MKKIAIIPLGGIGNRFKKEGFDMPKPLVNVIGKPIIYWLIENLNLTDIEYVCIPYNKELLAYNFENILRSHFSNIKFRFYCIQQNTRGTAETIKIALEYLNETNKHVVCIDGDNFYSSDILSLWNGENTIFSFKDDSLCDAFSYIKMNKDSKIINILEKNKISDYACCGIYAFKSCSELLDACNYVITNKIMEKEEFYLSVVVGEMIKHGKPFYGKVIEKNSYNCLGTPFHVKIFCDDINVNGK